MLDVLDSDALDICRGQPKMAEYIVSGDFTMFKYVKDLSPTQLEDKIGFQHGRLADGALILLLAPEETIAAEDFGLGASSRWSRSQAAALWAPQYVINPDGTMPSNAIEVALRERGQDVAALKEKVAKFFSLSKDNRPAKIRPRAHRLGDEYPNATGSGVPQFKLIKPKKFIDVRQV
jgi:hypothetical protein